MDQVTIFNDENQLKSYKIQLQFILVLSKSKVVDSTYKLVILKIHRTAVVFDCVLSVRHEAFVHAPQCYTRYFLIQMQFINVHFVASIF